MILRTSVQVSHLPMMDVHILDIHETISHNLEQWNLVCQQTSPSVIKAWVIKANWVTVV